MIHEIINFDLHELICPHLFLKYGAMSRGFLDDKQLQNMDWVRNFTNKPVYVNNWDMFMKSDYIIALQELIKSGKPIDESKLPAPPKGMQAQSGIRCNICSISLEKTRQGVIYSSAHHRGQADDYSIEGMLAEEVRQMLVKYQIKVPNPFRLENGVSWVHMDSVDTGKKVTLFNS